MNVAIMIGLYDIRTIEKSLGIQCSRLSLINIIDRLQPVKDNGQGLPVRL